MSREQEVDLRKALREWSKSSEQPPHALVLQVMRHMEAASRYWASPSMVVAVLKALAPAITDPAAEVAEARRAALEEAASNVMARAEAERIMRHDASRRGETELSTAHSDRASALHEAATAIHALSPIPAAAPDTREAEVALVEDLTKAIAGGSYNSKGDSLYTAMCRRQVRQVLAALAARDGKGAG